MTSVKNIYDYIHSFAPFDTQEAWDNSGFLIGEFQAPVERCVVCLDVSRPVFAFAQRAGAQLIVSHHPVIFSPLRACVRGDLSYEMIQSGISVISAHTNLDRAAGGINDALAAALPLKDVYQPEDGYIRVGTLKKPRRAQELAALVKERLGCAGVRFSAPDRMVEKLGLCGGAGMDFLEDVKKEGCDAFLTGDATYHNLLDCGEAGFSLIAAGHFETEQPGVAALRRRLKDLFSDVEFLDPDQTNPVSVV